VTESDPLYRKDLLRLAADAAGAGRLAAPDASATAHNPTCGDRVTVDLALDGERITALAHHTHACVLAQASAAILAGAALGLDRAGLAALAQAVSALLKDGAAPPHHPSLAAYAVFDGVAGHAGRHRCVLLPIEAALAALENGKERR
jgi:nitrogen fixation NifU-like protein